MRVALTISILLLGFITARSQTYNHSVAYYPYQEEISPIWTPIEANTPLYKYTPPTWWNKHKKSIAIMGVQMSSIILDAVGDGLYDIGKETHDDNKMAWGHTLQASAIGVNVLLLPMIEWDHPFVDGVWMAVSYVSMRYAIFDLTYNITRGLDPLYADGWKADMPPGGRAFTQSIAFGLSLSIYFKEF